MKKQRGMTMIGIVMVCIIIVLLAVGGLKVLPAYIEYFQIKKAVSGVVQSGEARGTVSEIRRAFDRRAVIDDFKSVTAADIEVTKEGNEVVISFAYPKKIPLFSNVSLLIDFAGSSNQ